ncbi:MAG TPA: VOC family protein [Actinomycetales bacterium]|nr:VOC family protein [Actinomycetales bacterium]
MPASTGDAHVHPAPHQEVPMGSRLNPYINFGDKARQAMEFYRDVFGGELTMTTFGEGGGAQGADADKIMHAQLETPDGFTLMASDAPQGMAFTTGSAISVSLSGDEGDTLRRYWQKLSEGGSVTMPMQKQVWGDEFGMVTDQFGISWMVDIAPSS